MIARSAIAIMAARRSCRTATWRTLICRSLFLAAPKRACPGRFTMNDSAQREAFLGQLRLLLEELCCDLCRFIHVSRDRLPPDHIHIDREIDLGLPGAFADIRVRAQDQPPYFVEIKYGYTSRDLTQ